MNEKRISAGIIDFFISCIIQSILFIIFIVYPLITRNIEGGYVIITRGILITLISVVYLLTKDIIGDRSIGKKILKLKIIDESGNNAKFIKRLLRNITWVIGLGVIELLMLLFNNKRIGDYIAKTKVIEIDKKI